MWSERKPAFSILMLLHNGKVENGLYITIYNDSMALANKVMVMFYTRLEAKKTKYYKMRKKKKCIIMKF